MRAQIFIFLALITSPLWVEATPIDGDGSSHSFLAANHPQSTHANNHANNHDSGQFIQKTSSKTKIDGFFSRGEDDDGLLIEGETLHHPSHHWPAQGTLQDVSIVPNFSSTGCAAQKRVALTFDDGPLAGSTNEILDILSDEGVRVTFFVVGRQVKSQQHLIDRMVDEGHELAVHTYSHSDLHRLSLDQIDREIEKGLTAIEQASGVTVYWWRAPYGNIPRGKTIAGNLGLQHVSWSADSQDWKKPNKDQWWSNIFNSLSPNHPNIVLLHDHAAVSRQNLRDLIRHLREDGYDLLTVSDLYQPVCE